MRAININVLSVVTLLGSMSAATGCRQEVESTDIRTSGVFPVIDVTADGSGSSRVEVRLKVGGRASNTYLELVGDDSLQVTAAGTTKVLDSSGGVAYAATFPTEAPGTFLISFMRGAADTSAPSTTVELPTPFTMALEAREVSRSTSDLAFTWSPSTGTGDMESTLFGSCINTVIEPIPDDGAAIISRDRIHPPDSRRSETCTVTLSLARRQSGQVDPAFTEGGTVTARQVRSATFTTMP
jgi:hypothetical protein